MFRQPSIKISKSSINRKEVFLFFQLRKNKLKIYRENH